MAGVIITNVDINAKTITYQSIIEFEAQIVNITTNQLIGSPFQLYTGTFTVNYVTTLGAASDSISVGDGLLVIPPQGGRPYSDVYTVLASEPAPEPEPAVPCVCAGTMIRTAGGERAVETLAAGDLILTADGREVAIKGIYTTEIAACTGRNAPYVIQAGAFSHGLPTTDLTISPGHALMVRPGQWMIPCHTTDPKLRAKMSRYANGQQVTYYHVELPNYLQDTFIANGVVSEAYGLNWAMTYKGPSIYTQMSNGYFTRCTGNTIRSAAKHTVNKK